MKSSLNNTTKMEIVQLSIVLLPIENVQICHFDNYY